MQPTQLAYFDCFHGAAGDMLLAGLLDAADPRLDLAALKRVLAGLALTGYTLEQERTTSHHVRGSRLHVRVAAPEAQVGRTWAAIRALLATSTLPERTRDRASATFARLARAEAAIHSIPVDAVHFHEVGALDSIVDVVGVCAALELLGIEGIYASPLPVGRGQVSTQHGPLPVPAPATLALLAEAGAPVVPAPGLAAGDPGEGELVTPTAAALLCELARFQQPPLRLQRVGYGFGHKQFPRLNGLRVWLGTQEQAPPEQVGDTWREQVVELRCNVDDTTGELAAYALEQVLAAGALDAWAAPLVMKKGRPALQIGCLARPDDVAALVALLLRETSTFGVRWVPLERSAARRAVQTVPTPWGPVRLKQKLLDGTVVARAPEYEDCAALARAHGVPLAQVYAAALQAGQSAEG